MRKTTGQLSVFFEDPFWVGLYERTENGQLTAARHVFGAEPRDNEVYAWLLEEGHMLRFSPAVEAARPQDVKNPKRRLREARRAIEGAQAGTRSQQALAFQLEIQKEERKDARKRRREDVQERKFALRQEKKKQKHRGK